MRSSSLDSLFSPRSIAIIGASSGITHAQRRGNIGSQIFRNLIRGGMTDSIYPIHSTAEKLDGIETHRRVGDIQAEIDLAVVAVAAERVVPAIEECVAAGVRAAMIVAAGFAEAGPDGVKRQAALADLIRSSGIRVLGPNCIGYLNLAERVSATFAFDTRVQMEPGPVAIVSQSGGLLSHIATQARAAGVRFGWLVSTGNEVDVDVSASLLHLVQRPEVRTIIAFCESIRDPDTFIEATRLAAELEKPIVLLHGGHSEGAARAARSHTASIAGSSAVLAAVCEQFGVIQVSTVAELLDVSLMLQTGRHAASKRVGILTPSGGTGILLADAVEGFGLELPVFTTEMQARIRRRMPPPFYGATDNPIDTTANMAADPSCYVDAFSALVDSDEIDMAVTVAWPAANLDWLITKFKETDKPIAVLSTEVPRELALAGVPTYTEAHQVGAALAAVVRRTVAHRDDTSPTKSDEAGHLRTFNFSSRELHLNTLVEHRTKELVRGYGIATTREMLAMTKREAITFAQRLGYPVALKIVSSDVAHKSDIGGVLLSLANKEAVALAYDELCENLSRYASDALFEGVLVQEMLPSGYLELIGGFHRDPTFGAIVSVGIGGVAAEKISVSKMLRVPFTREMALDLIGNVAGGRLVTGHRGLSLRQQSSLAEILLALGEISLNFPEIAELDLNPLLVLPNGLYAADGFAALQETSSSPKISAKLL